MFIVHQVCRVFRIIGGLQNILSHPRENEKEIVMISGAVTDC